MHSGQQGIDQNIKFWFLRFFCASCGRAVCGHWTIKRLECIRLKSCWKQELGPGTWDSGPKAQQGPHWIPDRTTESPKFWMLLLFSTVLQYFQCFYFASPANLSNPKPLNSLQHGGVISRKKINHFISVWDWPLSCWTHNGLSRGGVLEQMIQKIYQPRNLSDPIIRCSEE